MSKRPRYSPYPPTPAPKDPREDSPYQAGLPGGPYYSARLKDPESRKRLGRASKLQGVDQELAILRWRLEELIVQEDKQNTNSDSSVSETKNHALVLKTIELIVRAYSAKERASEDSNAPTEKGIENILRDASRKFGLKTIPWNSTR